MNDLINQVMDITGDTYDSTLTSMIKEREKELRKITKELIELKQLSNKLNRVSVMVV